jgi:hypothetical protein
VVEQLPEEVELLGRQPDLLLADVALPPARVEHELAVRSTPPSGLVFPALRRRMARTRATSSRGLKGFVR